MIINSEYQEAIGTGVDKAEDFEIEMSLAVFKMLTSDIYENPKLAIVREVACNCIDAHTQNNNRDEPFMVQLPNAFDPHLVFRDFGKGLNPEGMKIYRTIFKSTKSDSNDEIGGFGLGCKTPLSYTDQFTVVSRYDDKKDTYSVFVGENGPKCLLISSTKLPIAERTGLEVIIPIDECDFSTFANHASSVFSWFKVKPVVTGREISIEDNWFEDRYYYEKKRDRHYGDLKAVVGDVCYNANDVDVPRALRGFDLRVKFNIGEVSISPSRETLTFDERTNKAFKEVLDEIENVILNDIQEQIDKFDNIKELVDSRFWEMILDRSITRDFVFKGEKIKSSSVKIDFKGLSDINPKEYIDRYWKKGFSNINDYYDKQLSLNIGSSVLIIVNDHKNFVRWYNTEGSRIKSGKSVDNMIMVDTLDGANKLKAAIAEKTKFVEVSIENKSDLIKEGYRPEVKKKTVIAPKGYSLLTFEKGEISNNRYTIAEGKSVVSGIHLISADLRTVNVQKQDFYKAISAVYNIKIGICTQKLYDAIIPNNVAYEDPVIKDSSPIIDAVLDIEKHKKTLLNGTSASIIEECFSDCEWYEKWESLKPSVGIEDVTFSEYKSKLYDYYIDTGDIKGVDLETLHDEYSKVEDLVRGEISKYPLIEFRKFHYQVMREHTVKYIEMIKKEND